MAILKTVAPQFIPASVGNLYNPPGNESLRNIHVCNESGAAVTFSIWLGLTGGSSAGTALFKNVSIAAGAVLDSPFPVKLTTASFLTGVASSASALTVTITTQLEAS